MKARFAALAVLAAALVSCAAPAQDARKKEAYNNFAFGLNAMNHGNDEAAEGYFLKALALEPKSYNTRMYLARIYEKSGKRPEQIAQLREAAKVDPKDPRAYNALMAAHIEAGSAASAVKAGEEGVAAGAPEVGLAVTLGWSCYLAKDPASAEKYLKLAKEKIRNDTAPLNDLGIVYFSQGRYAEALSNFQEAGRLNPKSVLVPYFTALAYMRLGKDDEAAEAMREGVRRDQKIKFKLEGYNKQFFPYTDVSDFSGVLKKMMSGECPMY